jgi:hypothetical protein
MVSRGKNLAESATVAEELAGFVWAIAREDLLITQSVCAIDVKYERIY